MGGRGKGGTIKNPLSNCQILVFPLFLSWCLPNNSLASSTPPVWIPLAPNLPIAPPSLPFSSNLTSRFNLCKSVEKSGYLQTKRKFIASHSIYQNKSRWIEGNFKWNWNMKILKWIFVRVLDGKGFPVQITKRGSLNKTVDSLMKIQNLSTSKSHYNF